MGLAGHHNGVGGLPAPEPARRGAAAASILLVEPRPLLRECLALWLRTSGWDLRVLPVSGAAELPEDAAPAGGVDLILFNIAGAGVADGPVAATIARLRRLLPEAPIVLLSDREDTDQVLEAVRRGVRGYVPTSLPLAVAVAALQLVRAGGTFVPASALGRQPVRGNRTDVRRSPPGAVGASSLGALTARELAVVARLCEGKPNKIIAHELGIRDGTVKVHVRRIMKKLGATNRTQVTVLVRRLLERHEVPPGATTAHRPHPAGRSAG